MHAGSIFIHPMVLPQKGGLVVYPENSALNIFIHLMELLPGGSTGVCSFPVILDVSEDHFFRLPYSYHTRIFRKPGQKGYYSVLNVFVSFFSYFDRRFIDDIPAGVFKKTLLMGETHLGTFEFDGGKYKQASNHQKEWGSKLIAALPLKGDEKILDLGCGDGVLTKQLADIVPRGKVIGIDASEGMLKAADKLAATNLSFLLLDINNLEFKEEFDLIFSNAALHWVKDHLRLLQKCYFALKKGGLLRFNFGGAGNCINFSTVVKKVMQLEQHKECFVGFEWPWYMPFSGEYRRLLELTNFKKIEVWEQNADRFFRNAGELIKWIDQPSIVPFIKQVTEGEKEDFRHEVIKRMLLQTKQPDGTYFETFRRINVLAYK